MCWFKIAANIVKNHPLSIFSTKIIFFENNLVFHKRILKFERYTSINRSVNT
jgi:hypothetical protein